MNNDSKLIWEAMDPGAALRGFGKGATRGAIQLGVRLIQQDRFDEGWPKIERMLKPEHIPAVKKWAEDLPRPYANVSAQKILDDKEWSAWYNQVWDKLEPLLK